MLFEEGAGINPTVTFQNKRFKQFIFNLVFYEKDKVFCVFRRIY